MIDYKIGVDSEKLDRFKVERLDKYANKFLSSAEQEYLNELDLDKKMRFIASRFSAKEAIFKAIGTGISGNEFSSVTILPDENGKPIVDFEGYIVEVSITYTDMYVTTFAIIKTPST